MGPLGTLLAQIGLGMGLVWTMGSVATLFLPPTIGTGTILIAIGALLLAPKRVVMEFPISISLTAILGLSILSFTWTIDPVATDVVLRSQVPPMIAVIVAAGVLTMQDIGDALVWTIRFIVIVTVLSLLAFPDSRVHFLANDTILPGWHGLFLHKNKMSAFLVISIPTLLVYDRTVIAKWGTLGLIGVLLAGSSSATGMSAAAFVVFVYIWLKLYQRQRDARDSTLLFAVSGILALMVVIFVFAAFTTITSAYGKDTSLSGRTEIWAASFDAIIQQPFLGYGMGALFWTVPVSPETAEFWRNVGFEAAHAHNGLLDIALQIGLIGMSVFLVLFVSTFTSAWRAIHTRPDLSVWILAVLSATMLMSLSEDVFYGGWVAVFGLMKMVLMRREESLRRPDLAEGPVSKWAYR
jgi:O-antigen ligase